MSWKRDIPFGYKMEMSKIVPDKTEADIVKQIFSIYQNGDSLKRISERMEASGVRYRASTEVWKGDYILRVGTSSAETVPAAVARIRNDQIILWAKKVCGEMVLFSSSRSDQSKATISPLRRPVVSSR